MKKLVNLFDFSQPINYKNEILAGLAVSMTMIPESLSFAILAGLPPLTGLYAAFLMGIVTAVLGGRPGMVSGGAGATVVVLIALAAAHGIEYLFAAVVLAGILQLLVGIFKLGKFVRLIPSPVMYGFLNGLAIIIFMSQVDQFRVEVDGVKYWFQNMPLYIMGGLTLLTIAIVIILPKITKAVPASLVAIIVVFALVYFFDIDTKKVIDIASVGGSLPSFHIPSIPFTWETLKLIFPYSLVMAGVGLIESLLTLNMVDEMTGTRGSSNKEATAQGIANMTNGFFGGMGGCAMVAQSMVNISAGGRTRLSAIVASVAILFIILVAGPVIEQIPMAALVGVMMMVAIGTFEWASFKIVNKMPLHDIFVIVLVATITVVEHNLAKAVLIGVVVSALVFAWESAKRIRARKYTDNHGVKHYEIYGPLFFGSTTTFMEKFDVENDPDKVIIDFKESRITDMSAIETVNKLTDKYAKAGKKVYLQHLSLSCRRMIKNAQSSVDVNILETDYSKRKSN
ncbi:SulP family inorganic anion transporter [Myroides pelagicus]|uniref:SulP family inorganic anion transporter n=1 Tax=Myroides pelagicus TaxID=270914 RepID=UPI002DBFBBF4|nr:SulP family inorganic anion transporter [Myroides pelagicus]MEC4114212.1 SulP family inorganic anion transporter [Myroides pelagicus]